MSFRPSMAAQAPIPEQTRPPRPQMRLTILMCQILPETTCPPFPPAVQPGCDSRLWVESFTRKRCVSLASVSKIQECREGICEIENEKGADEACNSIQIGHGCGHEEGDDPIHRTESLPHPTSLSGCDSWEFEDLLEHLNIHGFHADVEVHHWRRKVSERVQI